MKLDICIAIFNEFKHTKKFINSLFDSTYHNFDLYITDNGSTDGSSDWINSLGRKNIHIHKFNNNMGCSAGWNQALRMGDSEYKVLTQNDIMFSKNWDKYLIKILEEYQDYGAVGSVEIENLDCSQKELDLLSEHLRKECIIEGSFYIPCILMKKDFFNKVGGFDENFIGGMYEDSDFIKRACNEGLKWCQYGMSIVSHDFGQTSSKHSKVGHNKKIFEEKWKNKESKPSYIRYNNPDFSKCYTKFHKIKREYIEEACKKTGIPYRGTK